MNAEELIKIANRGAGAHAFLRMVNDLNEALDVMEQQGISRTEVAPAIEELLKMRFSRSDLLIDLAQARNRPLQCGCIPPQVAELVHSGKRVEAAWTLAKVKRKSIRQAMEIVNAVYPEVK